MRFALLGNHPDGLAFVRSLLASGRHELIGYAGPKTGADELARLGVTVTPTGDIEEVLANPAVEAVVVASPPGIRAAHLRRALQSERHVVCVHPADGSPDIVYEAAMIQADTKRVLLPLLTDGLQPALDELVKLLHPPAGVLGKLELLAMDVAATEEVLIDAAGAKHRFSLPGWNTLRALGGEIAEVSAFTTAEELEPKEPLLVSGRFQSGGLFQYTLLPGQAAPLCRVRVLANQGTAELTLGKAGTLSWTESGERRELVIESPDPWPVILNLFENASSGSKPPDGTTSDVPAPPGVRPPLTWQDEVVCLELDDAVRRSVERRRATTMEYHEVSEEVGFKGTMTLVGCGLLWALLPLLMLAAWDKRFLWIVGPVLFVFLSMQLFRWVIPPREEPRRSDPAS